MNEWYIMVFILLIGVVYKTFLLVLYFNIGESDINKVNIIYDIVFIITMMGLILNKNDRRINNIQVRINNIQGRIHNVQGRIHNFQGRIHNFPTE